MKSRCLAFSVFVTSLLFSFCEAQNAASTTAIRYNLVDLGTFGGPQSYANIPPTSYAQVLNNSGTVTGWADTPLADPFPDVCFTEDCFVAHAFRGTQVGKRDLGVLPGGSSSQGNWISENGLIAGTYRPRRGIRSVIGRP